MKNFHVFIIFSQLVFVQSYSSGAPQSKSVCNERLPHHGVQPQDGPSPYVISVNTTSPQYGDYIEVTIESPTLFKGFILQALPIDAALFSGQSPDQIGTFTGQGTKLLNCIHNNDTVTHTENSVKTSLKFVFKMASIATYSRFHFKGTIVKDFMTFWTDVVSQTITTPDAGSQPAAEWARNVVETGHSLTSGKKSWEQNVRRRLQMGYSGMVDSTGQLKTRNIYKNLPFSNKVNTNNATDSNSFYKSHKQLHTLPAKSLMEEMLLGDVNSAVYLTQKLSFAKSKKEQKTLTI